MRVAHRIGRQGVLADFDFRFLHHCRVYVPLIDAEWPLREIRLMLELDTAAFHHLFQHGIHAPKRGFAVRYRVVGRRGLHDPGQQRGLRQVNVPCALIKVGLCGGLCAIGDVSEIDFVQVQFQNLVLGVAPPDFRRDDRFIQLATITHLGPAFWFQHQGFSQLLRDRAGPGDNRAGLQILDGRAQDGERVPAGILVEAFVLGTDHGVDQVRADLLQRDADARAAGGVVDLGQQVIVAVVDACGLKLAGNVRQGLDPRAVAVDARGIEQHRREDQDQREAQQPEQGRHQHAHDGAAAAIGLLCLSLAQRIRFCQFGKGLVIVWLACFRRGIRCGCRGGLDGGLLVGELVKLEPRAADDGCFGVGARDLLDVRHVVIIQHDVLLGFLHVIVNCRAGHADACAAGQARARRFHPLAVLKTVPGVGLHADHPPCALVIQDHQLLQLGLQRVPADLAVVIHATQAVHLRFHVVETAHQPVDARRLGDGGRRVGFCGQLGRTGFGDLCGVFHTREEAVFDR